MSPLSRQATFGLILVAIVAFAIEGIAQAFYFASHGRVYTRDALTLHLGPRSDPDRPVTQIAEIAQRRILHPYLGYAFDRPETMGAGGEVHPVQRRADGRFIVALTGGSVANQIRTVLGDALRAQFAERGLALEPVVVGLAVDGFKQPQQLASVAYFLSLGAEYDAVVNLDGFNDIVLPIVDNYQRGVFPFYPRSWNAFVNRRPSQQTLLGAGEIAFLRRQQDRRIVGAKASFLGRSAIAGLVHAKRLEAATARIAEIQRALLDEITQLSFEARGPDMPVDDIGQVYDAAAKLWARTSILMHQLLSDSGATYFHVLQPNQYVEGRKVLSSEEREQAIDRTHPYATPATRGYPYLFENADNISSHGVHYLDATGVFEAVGETVYRDACCHLNRFGKRLLGEQIARFVVDTRYGPAPGASRGGGFANPEAARIVAPTP